MWISTFSRLLMIGLLVWLTACGGSPALSNQTLVISTISDPKTFNNYLSEESSSRDAISYLVAGMTELDANTLQYKPSLAEKWEVFDEGLRYIFTLRPDLKWSDGSPLSAADVDFTFNQIIYNPRIPTSNRDVQRIGGLPGGLFLDPKTGELSGTPTEAGTFHFSIFVSDGAKGFGSRNYALNIAGSQVALPTPDPSLFGPNETGLRLVTDLPNGLLGQPYSQTIAVEGGQAPYRFDAGGMLPRVRMLDARRIEFTLPEPFAPFLIQAGVPVMPKHVLQRTITETDDTGDPLFLKTWGIDAPVEQILSAGPYLIREYTPGQRIVYTANPHYFQRGPAGETLPRIRRLVLRLVDSLDTSFLQFRSRETDVYAVRGSDFQLLKREEKRDDFTIYELGPTLNNNFITFNLSQAKDPKTGKPFVDPVKSRWFNDVNFRRAVAHAIDREGLVDSVLQGLGQPQDSPISPSSPFSLSREDGLPIYEYDPEKAKRILLRAGYRYDAEEHLLDGQGNRIRFVLNTNAGNTQREATGSLIKSDLAGIGITVDFVPISFNTLIQKTDTRDWDAILLSFGGGGTEPNNGSNIWRSSGRLHLWNLGDQPGNPAEGVVISDWEKEIDRIFAAGTRELDFDRRRLLYNRFQIIAQEQLPLIGTFNPLVLSALRNRIQEVDPRPILGPLWNLETVYLAE